MIAALYVQSNGAYYGVPGVDPWDEKRDARKYPGPYPVVAHPPCSRWCALAKLNQSRWGARVGDDGGCFASALLSLVNFGGVLEHPKNSLAWPVFGLPKPKRGVWVYYVKDGIKLYTTEISQSVYGHKAQKQTWLCYVSPTNKPPFSLNWRDAKGTHWVGNADNCNRYGNIKPTLSKKEASATPPLLKQTLLDLAAHSRG